MSERLSLLLWGLVLWSAILDQTTRAEQYDSRNTPVKIEEGVSVDKKLGDLISLDLKFMDESGKQVSMRDYMGKKSVVLAPVYYECPSLCGLTMNGLFRALQETKFSFDKDYELLFVSINPEEGAELAKRKKKNYVKNYVRSQNGAGMHFLTGEEANIKQLMSEVGFNYHYEESISQYVHPSTAIILTPEGKISQYLPGVEFSTRDLEFALIEASGNQIGNPIDAFFLYCYKYDPHSGKYGIAIMNVLRLLSVLTVIALGVFIMIMHQRVRRAKAQGND